MNKQDYTFDVRYRYSFRHPIVQSQFDVTATSLRMAKIMIDQMLSGAIIYSMKLVNAIIYH